MLLQLHPQLKHDLNIVQSSSGFFFFKFFPFFKALLSLLFEVPRDPQKKQNEPHHNSNCLGDSQKEDEKETHTQKMWQIPIFKEKNEES